MNKRIYFIGMPASGKTTLGKKLANKLSFSFVDLDWEIEKQEQMSIPAIFSLHGEAYFRRVEQKILRKTLPVNAVIATGGGAPCFFDNMDFILNHGYSIFLNTPLETLSQRAWAKNGSRPLLQQTSIAALQSAIQEKWENRKAYYHRAHYQVNAGKDALESILAHIEELTRI